MSTKNHTPITVGSPANSSTFNSPLGQLDSALGDLSQLTTTAKTDVVSAINELDSTKQDNFTSQPANQVLASPNGSSGNPGFRSIVNADLPSSGVTPGTFTKVTVNNKGVITSGGSVSASDISDITSLAVDTLGATTDNTNNNASTAKHGFFPKLVNDAMQLFNGVGAWVKWAMGIKYNGSGTYTPRSFINFSGAGVSVQDDPANDAIKVTISGIAGGTQQLSTLNDVSLASPVANEVLTYNASSQLWENKNITSFVPTGHVVASGGSNLTNRPTLNFSGTGVTTADNSSSNRTDVTITDTKIATDPIFTAVGDLAVGSGSSTATVLSAGSVGGKKLVTTGSGIAYINDEYSIETVIGDGSTAITTGIKGYVKIPVNSVLTSWDVVGDVSGSIIVDVWKDTYANFPPTIADTISGSATKVTLAGAQTGQNTTLTGWTTTLNKGDWLAYYVSSASAVKQVTVSLNCRKVAIS